LSNFVLDCSVTLAWCFEDETSEYADSVLDGLVSQAAIVPGIWSLEVANVLVIGERRNRLTQAQTAQVINLLQALPIVVDETTASQAMTATIALARQHHLSAYDAAYLELAMRLGLPLATLDNRLVVVANTCGVALYSA
jgi:predicted nucleic acid-binding protein